MPNYSEIALELQAELKRITHERDALQNRLEAVLNALKAIEVLAQDSHEPLMEPPPLSPDEEQGFTDQVRAILKANPARTSAAVDIRNLILERNPESDPKIALIHTHNTLKRLSRQGEVLETRMVDGRTGYQWKSIVPILDLMGSLKNTLAEMDELAKRRQSAAERLAQRERETLTLEAAGRRRRNTEKREE